MGCCQKSVLVARVVKAPQVQPGYTVNSWPITDLSGRHMPLHRGVYLQIMHHTIMQLLLCHFTTHESVLQQHGFKQGVALSCIILHNFHARAQLSLPLRGKRSRPDMAQRRMLIASETVLYYITLQVLTHHAHNRPASSHSAP
jgi:hypothetical protein